MGLRVNQNISALRAVRGFQQAQGDVARNLERLASAQRINSGADDPAGLIVSENLRAQTEGLGVQIGGAERTGNNLRTAEARFGEALDQLRAIRDRALDTLNAGATGPAARAANQTAAAASARTAAGILQGTDTTAQGVDSSGLAEIGRGLTEIDVSTPEGAAGALQTVDAAVEQITAFLGRLGGREGGLEAEARGLAVQRENLAASESAVRDADFAAEITALASNRIRTNTSIAAIARSNQNQRQSLGLIGGDGESRGGRISIFA